MKMSFEALFDVIFVWGVLHGTYELSKKGKRVLFCLRCET